MTDYTTIRVTKDAKAQAEQSKRDGETWNEFLQRCTDNPPERREFVDADRLLDRLRDDVQVADEHSDDVNLNRVLSRLDDLEASLPRKTAAEVRQQ